MNVSENAQLITAVAIGIFISLSVIVRIIQIYLSSDRVAYKRSLKDTKHWYAKKRESVIKSAYIQAFLREDEVFTNPHSSERDCMEVGAVIDGLEAIAAERKITLPSYDEIRAMEKP